MQAIRTFLFLGIISLSSINQKVTASELSSIVIPSFTVDSSSGIEGDGYIVNFTNTSSAINESCGLDVTYVWAIDTGTEGIDWVYVNGTNATSEDLAIEFITQGCYNVTLFASDCNGNAISNETEITVAGPIQLIVQDFTAISNCTNGSVEVFWQMASNNNNTIDFSMFLDGAPVSSSFDTFSGLSSCTDPGSILHANTEIIGFLTPGSHQLIVQAQGDLFPEPVFDIQSFEVYEAAELILVSDAQAYCANQQAEVQAQISLGLGPYILDWSIDGITQHTEVVNGTEATYSFDLTSVSGPANIIVTVIDANGCESLESIPIEVYDAVDITVTADPACENELSTFTASGNATQYVWPTSIFTVTNPVIAVGGSDSQSEIVGDGIAVDVIGEIVNIGTLDGDLTCSTIGTANTVVTQNPTLALSQNNGATFCADENPVLNASGADTYVWTPTPISQNGGEATFASNITSPLTGNAIGTIDYGTHTCSSSIIFSYPILDTPIVQLDVTNNIICGPSETVTVSTGGMDPSTYTFEWFLNGNILVGEVNNSLDLSFAYPEDAGINIVACQVTHNNGCIGGSVIEIEVLEGASVALSAPIICEGEPFYIDVVANGDITWDTNGATPFTDGYYYDTAPDGSIFIATATLTSVSILTDGQFDCVVSESITVETRANPDLDFNFSGTPCTGQSVQVDISGAESYTWSSSPIEDNSTINPDGSNFGLNILSLGYTSVIPGSLDVTATGSTSYADAGGLTCTTTETYNNIIDASTTFQLTGDTEICEGECINLSIQWDTEPNGATFSFDWYLDGALHSNSETFTECPTYATGVAEVMLVLEAGTACESSQTVFVNTTQMPVITASADVSEGCSPLTANFTATNQFASITAWNFDNGQNASGVDNTQMTFDCLDYSIGDCNYQVSYTAISPTNPNCTATEFVPIIVHPIPVSDFFLQETLVCYDEFNDATINAVNSSSDLVGQTCAAGNPPYTWTLFPTGSGTCTENLGETPTLTVSGNGSFTVGLDVLDQYGCTSQSFQDFLVAEAPLPEIGFFQTSVCLPTQIEILNTTTGAASFELEVPGFVIPTNFNSPFYLDIEYPGVYEAEFTVTSDEGCSVTLEIDDAFEAWYPPIADFTTDPQFIDVLEPIVNFINLTEGGTEYIWSFGDGDGSSEFNPSHEYYADGAYTVQLHVTNDYGCTDISTQTINVNNLLQIFVPNSFTPNNDGNNDAWFPVISGQELIAQYECWVYDRWGKLVYFSNTPGEPWVGDNKIDGAATHYISGTEAYSWRIEIKMVDGLGARTETGHLYLVR